MAIETHDLELVRNFDDGKGLWALCSCGWEADEPGDTEEAAIEQWENHCEVIFMEATGG